MKQLSNRLAKLKAVESAVFEIIGGGGSIQPPPFVEGVGTKYLSTGRVKTRNHLYQTLNIKVQGLDPLKKFSDVFHLNGSVLKVLDLGKPWQDSLHPDLLTETSAKLDPAIEKVNEMKVSFGK